MLTSLPRIPVGLARRLLAMSSRALAHQTTNRVLMIEPRAFGYDPLTAACNVFQRTPQSLGLSLEQIKIEAIKEFNRLASLLEQNGIEVNRERDQDEIDLPDAVFPNNWISFHSLSEECRPRIVIYPMMSQLRRKERQPGIIDKWSKALNASVVDMSGAESDDEFLEGTGSMVLDRVNRISYAATSSRTFENLVRKWCINMNYTPVLFRSYSCSQSGQSVPIYHTNVMMSLGEEFALLCLESIPDQKEREAILNNLDQTGKKVISISLQQINCFLGNMLQLHNKEGQRLVFMSTTAYQSMTEDQKRGIEETSKIVHCSVDTIQKLGGGGIRCMICEIFPPIAT